MTRTPVTPKRLFLPMAQTYEWTLWEDLTTHNLLAHCMVEVAGIQALGP